jgi:hypothetical protein
MFWWISNKVVFHRDSSYHFRKGSRVSVEVSLDVHQFSYLIDETAMEIKPMEVDLIARPEDNGLLISTMCK